MQKYGGACIDFGIVKMLVLAHENKYKSSQIKVKCITMIETQKPEILTRFSQSTLGLVAVIFTVILWATAANVATDLFKAGVNPFELAVSSMATATVLGILCQPFFDED